MALRTIINALSRVGGALSCTVVVSTSVFAQEGAVLFKNYCAICHEGDERAPSREVLAQMKPEQILQALEKGAMKAQAAERSRAQRRVLAEYLAGEPLGADANPIPKSAFCASATGADRVSSVDSAWNGWGVTITNSRFQPAAAAGLSADDVPRLKLKWAFGFPGASTGGTQPVVFAGRLYVATAEGDVYALDPQTGCIYWTFEAEAGIRSAITIGRQGADRHVAYFGDQVANVYAVDARTGTPLWKVKVDENDRAAITGAPQLHEGRLYVPVSSREESQVGNPKYPCCRFRGSVVALDAASGTQIWKAYTIAEAAFPTQKNLAGTQLWGPSGGAVWNAVTIDVKRNRLYFGTGNNFSTPATKTSDSILAVDMRTGRIDWVHQLLENDVWNANCRRPDRDPVVCPDADAPDIDFSASPVLVDLKGGRQVLIAGSKGGKLLALDPDRQGKAIWNMQLFDWPFTKGRSGVGSGILWGVAVGGETVYAANGFTSESDPKATGGMAAVDIREGRVMWRTPAPPCGTRKPCKPASPGAVTAIPGAAFSGTLDGLLRAYSTRDGRIIWEYDTLQEYSTVDGVKANGGSMSNAGPTVAGGMLFMNSGYSHHGGVAPGNVLLAFAPE